jgi:AcrR family transcriptional regulator
MIDTRERLLQAAEQSYARFGFEGTSLRALTAAAGVNLAAVNYHFGSKRGLLMEMSRRVVDPINRERLELLARAREETPSGPLSLEAIFEAFMRPVARYASINGKPNLIFLRLIGRFMSESDDFYHEVVNTLFREVADAFLGELARTLPQLPPAELRLRFHFALSSMLGALSQYHRIERGLCAGFDISDITGLLDRLRDFICAGFRGAPTVAGKEGA